MTDDDPMGDGRATRQAVRDELDRVRRDFSNLIANSTDQTLAKRSDGTRWTNRELLFHMLFGYLITRNLRVVLKIVPRLPGAGQRAFASSLDATAKPFDVINYLGSCIGGRILSPQRMDAWMGGVIESLKRHVVRDSDAALLRSMPFPSRWDPYFTDDMTLLDVYHYATLHYDHHRAQLTLTD
ncbi:MAG: DinB family protein [Jatrophihabitans sp.]|uniref:DinB family protein n=1 Tax=Jatrophihabitans sp. TaxID=1932789 RepID=UPI0039103E2B